MWTEIETKVYRFIQENKITPESLKELETMGMIPKRDLKAGMYYQGVCRNTTVAMWMNKPTFPSKTQLPNDVANPRFFHMRLKFNNIFVETINHPEDDDGYDLFIPLAKIG